MAVTAFWVVAGFLLWDSALGIRVRATFGVDSACASLLSVPSRRLTPPFRPMSNPSASMEPILPRGSVMVVAAVPAGWLPKRGELIVFNVKNTPGTAYIKRVVGLAGDSLRFDGAKLVLNGQVVPATNGRAASANLSTRCRAFDQRLDDIAFQILDCGEPIPTDANGYLVPPGHVFVLGDNRDNSADSRMATFGMVDAKDVIGLPHCLEKR